MNNVIGLLVCMCLRGWKDVGSNLGLKKMDSIHIFLFC